MTDTTNLWRTGRHDPHELYYGDERRGEMQRAEDAKAVCEAMTRPAGR
jgi:hypothetical protein